MLLEMNSTSGAAGSENRTKTVSLRLTEAEHAKIREIAARLGAAESAVIRYAIRSMINRLAPLHEADTSGFSLIPVFVEHGAELSRYFDLDASRLERIINGEEKETQQVEKEDLVLLAMSGLAETKVHAKLRELQETSIEQGDLPASLRNYFYDKYIYQTSVEKTGD
jgi:hypothetical protein